MLRELVVLVLQGDIMMLPNDRLLSEVLKIELLENSVVQKENIIAYLFISEELGISAPRIGSLNIYELAHKCKEWVLRQGYLIDTRNQGMTTVIYKSKIVFVAISKQEGDTLESDFKSCEWILEQKEKK